MKEIKVCCCGASSKSHAEWTQPNRIKVMDRKGERIIGTPYYLINPKMIKDGYCMYCKSHTITYVVSNRWKPKDGLHDLDAENSFGDNFSDILLYDQIVDAYECTLRKNRRNNIPIPKLDMTKTNNIY